MKNNKGITLIALVITIIVLIILAGVTINVMLNNNGIIGKAEQAKVDTQRETATEKMNLKITNIQIEEYTQKQELPKLQQLADNLCEDSEIQYVTLASNKIASLEKISVGDAQSIFTKMKDYPYEFEINSSLQLASVDGIEVANNTVTVDKEQWEGLLNTVPTLQKKPVLIKRDFSPSTISITASSWTIIEDVSLAGHGSGIAMISYNASNAETVCSVFDVDVYDETAKFLGSDGNDETSNRTWRRASVSVYVPYNENTKIRLRAYSNVSMKIRYGYSITLFKN